MGDAPETGQPATARLALRPLRAGDAPVMTRLADDFDIARMTTSIPHPFMKGHAEDFIARMGACDEAREAAFAIDGAHEGFMGVIGLHPTPGGTELGYWLGRAFWGRGLATEAATAAVKWAERRWGRRFLVSGHFVDNAASGRVLSKVGFLYTGEVVPRFSRARDAEARTRMMVWLA